MLVVVVAAAVEASSYCNCRLYGYDSIL